MSDPAAGRRTSARRGLRRIALDFSPLRESRDFRLLSLGAFELIPMIVVSLLGGAAADRLDRRRVLVAAQLGVISAAAALAVVTLTTRPPVGAILGLGGLLAGSAALDSVARGAIIPRVVRPERLRSALAFNCVRARRSTPPILRSIGEGLRFVRRSEPLAGSFAIDLVAMTFGWPRAMFAVLSLTVYHAGARGTGLLFAALAVGGTVSVLSAGWIEHTHRLGRIVIVAVLLWGAAIAGAGVVRSLAPALVLLAVAGSADGISAVCRSAINQTVTPDGLRGRMSALYSLVVTGGPRLGDIESGLFAGLTSATTAVLTGGLACIAGAVAVVAAFPAFAGYDSRSARLDAGEATQTANTRSSAPG